MTSISEGDIAASDCLKYVSLSTLQKSPIALLPYYIWRSLLGSHECTKHCTCAMRKAGTGTCKTSGGTGAT